MIIAVLGTTCSGKTTLANMYKKHQEEAFGTPCSVISMDEIRFNGGYHCPWQGFDTEIQPWRQREFDNDVLSRINKDVLKTTTIIEGNAMSPDDATRLMRLGMIDDVILLARLSVSPYQMLKECRQVNDKSKYTSRRSDMYLLRYFTLQQKIAHKWASQYDNFLIDTTNLSNGIQQGINHIDEVYRYLNELTN